MVDDFGGNMVVYRKIMRISGIITPLKLGMRKVNVTNFF
jgi:hypothetical protein